LENPLVGQKDGRMSEKVEKRRAYAARMPVEQRRESLLDAALGLVDESGVGAVTMEAVARAAGVTKPVVYGAFSNAESVLEALIEREQARAFAQMLSLLPEGVDLDDPGSVTTAGMTGFLAAVRQNPATWRLLLARDGLPAAAAEVRERSRQYFVDQLNDLATWALADRRGGPLDPVLTAQLIVAGLEMGAQLVLHDPDGFSEERMVTFVAELVRSILQG
jgi:AcrR family transcriptional regulator